MRNGNSDEKTYQNATLFAGEEDRKPGNTDLKKSGCNTVTYPNMFLQILI